MDSDESKICDSCYARHTTNAAVIWCPHCGEGFCTNCGECHNTSKVGKFHETISIDDFQKLPSIIAEIKTNCAEHEEIYELYCHIHRQCFCLSCLKGNHQECKDVSSLRDVIRNVKSSAALEDIEMSLRNTDELLSKLKENRLENKRRLEGQKTEYLTKIKQLRLSINNHLDKLENEIVDEISSEVETIKLSIDDILEEIQERNKNVKKMQEDIASVKQMSTELQVFLGLKTFQDLINDETEYLANLQREEKVNDIVIEYDISRKFSSFCDGSDSFGEFSVSQNPSSLNLNIGKKERAQNTFTKEMTLSDVNVGLQKRVSYPSRGNGDVTSVTGCTILHDGSFVFADNGNGILVISDESGVFRDVVSLSSLYDVAYIGSGKVVATLIEEKEIVFIDLLLGNQFKRVILGSKCHGIDFMNDKIAVKGSGIFLITDQDGNISSQIKAKCLTHVAILEDKIFGTHDGNNSVICCSTDGSILWKFEDDVMKSPRDITVDGKGFTYIACEKSNNVVVISPDGKAGKEILNKSNGLDSPVAIHFEKTLMKLLVCNSANGAILCDILQA